MVLVKEHSLKRDLYYKDNIVLSYTINYPQFYSEEFNTFIKQLDFYYESNAVLFERFHVTELYQMAVDDYENAVANNFPVRAYEVLVNYTITYNQDCILSLYFDRYEYTGGAHGMTNRYSDNWNLKSSRKFELGEFFPGITDIKTFITGEVIRQIEANLQTGDYMYFEDYASLVEENFDILNFYLTEEGVVIFFQLYEIAPYVSGIPTFLIPFSEGGAKKPSC